MFRFEMQSTCNAPEYMEGKYELTIKNRRMVLKKIEDGKPNVKVRGTCCKSDNFDFNTGVNNVLTKMKDKLAADEIKIGDMVKVINNGSAYTTYSKWVANNAPNTEAMIRYAFGKTVENGTVGEVVAVAPHEELPHIMLYLVKARSNNHMEEYYYLIQRDGIRKLVH